MPKNEHSRWLNDIFERTPDGIVILTRAGIILAANDAFGRIFGLAPQDAVGQKIQNRIPTDQRRHWLKDIKRLFDNEWSLAESFVSTVNGRQTPIQINSLGQTKHAGQAAFILHIRDQTIYQTVAHALSASEDQWQRSFDAITDWMCLLNHNGQITRANLAMSQKFQSLFGSLIGQHYKDIFKGLNRHGSPLPDDFIQAAPYELNELSFPCMEGWFSLSAFPLKNEKNALTGTILIMKDISAAYKAQKALKTNEARLHQVAKMEAIGRMAGSIAHDFNNLLTSILGYTALMQQALPDDKPCRSDLQEIIHAAERATQLTRQLLDFSQQRPLETEVIKLNASIESMENFMRQTLGDNIKLNLHLDKKLWNIRADASRLEQILMNLTINARDAMPKGGQFIIRTSNQILSQAFCSTHHGLLPEHYILLEVSDTGEGMPAEVLDHIFEPFFTTKAKGKGTGLGLLTVYSIVRQFNGCIFCYSEVAKGTTFQIYLPACRDASRPTAPSTNATTLPRGQETLLVVDDMPNIAAMVSQLLQRLGYQVLTAPNSQQALIISGQHPAQIDLVLTDIVMPDISGVELVRRLAQQRPNIKALYMSGYANEVAYQTTELKKDDFYLQKPFNTETLALFVRKILDQPPRPTGASAADRKPRQQTRKSKQP